MPTGSLAWGDLRQPSMITLSRNRLLFLDSIIQIASVRIGAKVAYGFEGRETALGTLLPLDRQFVYDSNRTIAAIEVWRLFGANRQTTDTGKVVMSR